MSTRIAHFHRRQRGFTLAEILVTTAIFAIIMIAALAVYDRSNRVFKTSTESADMQQSTRVGFDKLVSDVRMAGFDYSRGGDPQNGWEWRQPDEQIEYAGPSAVGFRANFNYNTASAQGNGLESAYTPRNVGGQAIFPYVTTSNDEIVAYVLRSTTATANTGSISFYVDDYMPRRGFPSTITPAPAGANPSTAERQVTIGGIDTTNNNPPYTLYRVTDTDVRNASLGTPVAENIRSLNFQYYSDATGATLLTNNDGTAVTTVRNAGGGSVATVNTGALGGDGQYDPNNVGSTSNFVDRTQRGLIMAVRVSLVGMNSSPDLQGYTNPTETVAAIRSYRQYALSSLVVPRNLGKTGFPEPTYNPPGPPTITGMCIGHCGAPAIYWQQPAVGGPVVQFRIEWDTTQNGAFTTGVSIPDPSATSAVLSDDGSSDVSQVRYYRIIAQNDNGESIPSALFSATPQNKTKPSPVSLLTASTLQTSQITLNWNAPSTNASGFTTLSCTGTGGSTDGTAIPPQETLKYQVWRGIDPTFDPTSANPAVDHGVMLVDFTSATPPQPPPGTPGGAMTWVDSGTLASGSPLPPANCKTYYYRVRVADRCSRNNNWNVSNNAADSISAFYPPLAQPGIPGSSTSRVTPQAPTSLRIDRVTPNATGCPDPQNVGSPNCRITLNWNKVFADSGGTAIGVDTYRITRSVRVQAVGGPYLPDPLMGGSGQLNVTCVTGTCATTSYSQQLSGSVGYVDFPPVVDGTGLALEYQYTVAALGCAGAQTLPSSQPNDPYSPESNSVQYPGCSINPAIVEAGAQNPGASGDSPGTAWIFNSGDTVVVTPSVGSNVVSVQFITTMYPQGTAVPGLSPPTILAPGNAAPSYVLSWSDQNDGQIYMIRIVVTNNVGCQETHVKYIQDQQGAPCAFPNQTLAASCPGCLAIPNSNNANTLATYSVTLTIPNNGTSPMQMANRNLIITWDKPAGDTLHGDLKLTSLVWTVPSSGSGITLNLAPQIALASPAPTVTTVTAPSNIPNLAVGASMTLQIRFQYLKNDDCASQNCPPLIPANEMTAPPVRKLCMDYQIAAEPGVTKHCNVVGQSGSTGNPTTCD
jgi:prepilin-type N-terminal cleavage/methylation domain-containing protein